MEVLKDTKEDLELKKMDLSSDIEEHLNIIKAIEKELIEA